MKDFMESFEQRNNEDKEEKAVPGATEADETRKLSCWLGHKQDVEIELKGPGCYELKFAGNN